MPAFNTSVPSFSLTEAGFIAPSEQEILAGFQADINAALGGNANMALNTPQGQIAMSNTAVLGNTLASILSVFNSIDPARASGRMQDAIGRIWLMTRKPASNTTVNVTLILNNTSATIPAGTPVAIDTQQNTYATASDITLSNTDRINVQLVCTTPGAIPCPAESLSLYQGGLGIASLTNEEPGSIGNNTETRAEFENRRKASVAANSTGQNASLLGALLALENVTDAYVVDNPTTAIKTVGGVTITPHSLYCVIEGGTPQDIGRAILNKKPPGCATTGTQCITVQDTNPAYNGNGPSYTFHYDIAKPTPLYVSVSIANSPAVPADAIQQIQDTITNATTTGLLRARLGATLYASRITGIVNNLGKWADVLELTIGTTPETAQNHISLPINQIPSITPQNISVRLS